MGPLHSLLHTGRQVWKPWYGTYIFSNGMGWKSGEKIFHSFLPWKSLLPWKGMLVCCSSSIGHGFHVQAPWGMGLLQSHIFFPSEIVDYVFLGSSSWTTVLSLTNAQGKSHPSVESRWAQRRWSSLPSEKFRPSGCHGNGMLPTKHCDTTDPLWEGRRAMGPKGEALTITAQLLYIRQPELMFRRDVDTKLKEDPLDVLDNWMISILSSILLMAIILIRLLSKEPLLRLAFRLWYIWKGPVSLSLPVFCNRRK